MIRYQPPKSRIWGHQVGGLNAVAVVDRCALFLSEQCSILSLPPSELMIGWSSSQHDLVSPIAIEIDRTLGVPTTSNELPSADSQVFRQRRWPFSAEALPTVAKWFDKLAESMKTSQVVAQSSTIWSFAWRDELPPLLPFQSAGGMFGIHLGQPHRVSTMFSFRDIERYQSIKTYLLEIGLTELSDKHLRPRTALQSGK